MEFDYPLTTIGVDAFRIMQTTGVGGRAYVWNTEIGFAGDWVGTPQQISTTQTNKVIWRLNTLSDGDTFVGGVKGANKSGTAWVGIDKIYLFLGAGALNIKNLQVYDTALTDAECIALTSL